MKDNKDTKIAVVGAGYVGLSLATLLSQQYCVKLLDISEEKVNMVNDKRSPIKDEYIERFLKKKQLLLEATTESGEAYREADFTIISVPTDYDENRNYFNTSIVENTIKEAFTYNPNTTIVIKSTVPIGFTQKIAQRYADKDILFAPEFLRESKALYDNLYPSRIIIGIEKDDERLKEKALTFIKILKTCTFKEETATYIIGYSEAEAVKLFSNTYLALRVGFFNEIDAYAEFNELDPSEIIEGVCADPRIGNGYNNPSFGYGGYCLPKDTKQMLANYEGIPGTLIKAIVESNETRKEFIAEQIGRKTNGTIGIYRLVMKSSSDNFRQSAVQDVIQKLKKQNTNIIIYEPILSEEKEFAECRIVNDLKKFKETSQIIIANRYNPELEDVKEKVYTRDIYGRD